MKRCPLLNKDCIAERCMWWQQFTMRDVSSQEVRTEFDCAVTRIPMMLLDVIKNTNGTAAAVEKRGNEMIQAHQLTNRIFAGMAELAVSRHDIVGPGERKELPGAHPDR